MTSRPALRQDLRQQRRALSPAEHRQRAEQLARQFSVTRLFRASRHIACYIANDGEIDPLALMQRAWALGKTCYLPVLHGIRPQRLWFAAYRPGDDLVYNRFGIAEPNSPRREWVHARCLDIICTPLVAFDAQGNRIGMGGGFYDRTLAFMQRRRSWRRPHMIGLAYEFQKVDIIAHRPWDVPLQAVVTEQRVYRQHEML